MYKDKNNVIEDSFQSFLVEGASFTEREEYPIIPESFVSKEVPKTIMPFDKAYNSNKDLSDVFICTYARDYTFERIRRNPKRYLDFFKKCAGLIGFDFSIHTDMPFVKQKAQMNDNLSLTYYYGLNGISIIPNVRCGADCLANDYLSAIPKNSLISVGTHGFIKERRQKAEWFCFLEKVINKLNPSGIIVYGSLSGNVFNCFKDECNIYCYDPWIKSDRRRRLEDVH